MKHTFTINREARCLLQTQVTVEGDDEEQAREKAIGEAEDITDPAKFTVVSIDLRACEGSSEIVEP